MNTTIYEKIRKGYLKGLIIMTEIDYSKFDDFEVEEMADVLYKEYGIDYSYTTWKEARIMIIEDYIDLYSCEAEQEKNTNKN